MRPASVAIAPAARLCCPTDEEGKGEKHRHVAGFTFVRNALRNLSYRVANNNFDDATRFESRELR